MCIVGDLRFKIEFWTNLGFNTVVLSFLDTAVCGGFSVRCRKRPRYRICWIPRSCAVFGPFWLFDPGFGRLFGIGSGLFQGVF